MRKFAFSSPDFNPRTGPAAYSDGAGAPSGGIRHVMATANTRPCSRSRGHVGEQRDRIGDRRPHCRRELSRFQPH